VDEENEPMFLPPSKSSAREGEILSAMAHLTIRRTRTILKVLDDLCACAGMDMLLLSAYDSALLQTKMDALRLSGNTVTLQLIDKGEAEAKAV
jgi:hypothetical protein